MGLRNKDLISIHDLSVGEVATILDVAKKLKRKQKSGEPHQYLKGKISWDDFFQGINTYTCFF